MKYRWLRLRACRCVADFFPENICVLWPKQFHDNKKKKKKKKKKIIVHESTIVDRTAETQYKAPELQILFFVHSYK